MQRFLLSIGILLGASQLCSAQVLASYKDDLFGYPAVIEEKDGGAYRVIDYQEARDINARDEVPERRVRRDYVSLGVRSKQKDMKLQTEAGTLRFVAVGTQANASMIVLYLHGQGGSRRQGVDDYTFGGNFNRVKNLVAAANGLYLSPDFSTFGEKGAAEIAALIAHFKEQSPKAKVFVACGSMGGALCWRLAKDVRTASFLGGLLLLGSLWDESFIGSAAHRAKVPLFFGHGSRDTVFPVASQEAFYRKVRAGGYPVRFVRFETGTHGTPIRMTDWRDTLNWMLAN